METEYGIHEAAAGLQALHRSSSAPSRLSGMPAAVLRLLGRAKPPLPPELRSVPDDAMDICTAEALPPSGLHTGVCGRSATTSCTQSGCSGHCGHCVSHTSHESQCSSCSVAAVAVGQPKTGHRAPGPFPRCTAASLSPGAIQVPSCGAHQAAGHEHQHCSGGDGCSGVARCPPTPHCGAAHGDTVHASPAGGSHQPTVLAVPSSHRPLTPSPERQHLRPLPLPPQLPLPPPLAACTDAPPMPAHKHSRHGSRSGSGSASVSGSGDSCSDSGSDWDSDGEPSEWRRAARLKRAVSSPIAAAERNQDLRPPRPTLRDPAQQLVAECLSRALSLGHAGGPGKACGVAVAAAGAGGPGATGAGGSPPTRARLARQRSVGLTRKRLLA